MAPTFSSISPTAGSYTVVANFDQALLCSTVASSDFTATINGDSRAVTAVACTGATDATIELTLAGASTLLAPPAPGDTVAVTLAASAVTDQAGNEAAAATRSNTVPTIVVTAPADDALTNDNTPTYSGTASDGATPAGQTIVAVQASVDGGAFTPATCPGCPGASVTWSFTSATLAEGTHTIAFRAVDNDGGISNTVTRTVTIDTTIPTFTSIDATAGSPTVVATFSEAISCSTVSDIDFTATIGGAAVVVSSVSCTGAADATVEITLVSAPSTGQTVAVQLVGTVNDAAGNAARPPPAPIQPERRASS